MPTNKYGAVVNPRDNPKFCVKSLRNLQNGI